MDKLRLPKSCKYFLKQQGYQKYKKIGKGMQGYIIKTVKNHKTIVIKIIFDKNHFKNETKLLYKLRYVPNIPTILFAKYHHNIYYIGMNYIHGKTLKQYVIDHPLINIDYIHLEFIFKQLVQIIHQIQQYNVYHMDIYDENILIDSNGIVYLIDFGVGYYDTLFIEEDKKMVDVYLIGALLKQFNNEFLQSPYLQKILQLTGPINNRMNIFYSLVQN